MKLAFSMRIGNERERHFFYERCTHLCTEWVLNKKFMWQFLS